MVCWIVGLCHVQWFQLGVFVSPFSLDTECYCWIFVRFLHDALVRRLLYFCNNGFHVVWLESLFVCWIMSIWCQKNEFVLSFWKILAILLRRNWCLAFSLWFHYAVVSSVFFFLSVEFQIPFDVLIWCLGVFDALGVQIIDLMVQLEQMIHWKSRFLRNLV